MRQRPDSIRTQRTQPGLGVTRPTTPIVITQSPQAPRFAGQPGKNLYPGRRGAFLFLGMGVIVEVFLLALIPLLTQFTASNDPVQIALLNLFPWAPKLYWTTSLPLLLHLLAQVPVLNPTTLQGNTTLVVLIVGALFLCLFLAARLGNRIVKERLSTLDNQIIFWTILALTTLFALTMLCAPIGLNALSQDMLLYGAYGHVVVVYRANPYVASPASFHGLLDPLQTIIGAKTTGVAPYGPVWMDVSVLVTLFAHSVVANILLGFRLLGLVAHLASVALLWTILSKVKPALRISATVLYAWNPLVLLFSITMMHQDVVLVMLLLAAMLFFQRNSPTLGWVLVLLAALLQPLCLLLLPLFLRFMAREARIMAPGLRIFWWLGTLCITILAVALSYIPYWQGWDLGGFGASMHRIFLQDTTINSLDAALLHLPVQAPAAIDWIINSHHWSVFALLVVGLVILFGLWLIDTVELLLLFSCWVLLLLAVLLPVYWPWLILPPLALALCSGHSRSILLAIALSLGTLFCFYCWLWPSPWLGQGLVNVGVPLLLWGWMLFFTSTWQMTHANEAEQIVPIPRFSRPSRPSRPGPNRR